MHLRMFTWGFPLQCHWLHSISPTFAHPLPSPPLPSQSFLIMKVEMRVRVLPFVTLCGQLKMKTGEHVVNEICELVNLWRRSTSQT